MCEECDTPLDVDAEKSHRQVLLVMQRPADAVVVSLVSMVRALAAVVVRACRTLLLQR